MIEIYNKSAKRFLEDAINLNIYMIFIIKIHYMFIMNNENTVNLKIYLLQYSVNYLLNYFIS